MRKIIYISGLGHSGSTILDMALGSHPNIIGLGEIFSVIRKDDHTGLFENSTCSCGEKANDCSFWKKTKNILKSEKNHEQKYFSLLDLFYEEYNEDTILVDSSKNSYRFLKLLNDKYDLRLLFLTRDFRSWAYSRFSRMKKPLLFFMIRWYFENKKLLYMFKKYKLNYLKIGYEELALYPEYILRITANYIGRDYTPEMISLLNSKSHIISGNIARIDDTKKERIRYDSKWLVSVRVNLMSWCFFLFQRLNNRLVYSNVYKGKIKAFGKQSPDFYIFGNKRKEELDDAHN